MVQNRAISRYTLLAAKKLLDWPLLRPPQAECFCPTLYSLTSIFLKNIFPLLKLQTLFNLSEHLDFALGAFYAKSGGVVAFVNF